MIKIIIDNKTVPSWLRAPAIWLVLSFWGFSVGENLNQGNADVLNVQGSQSSPGVWSFRVTVMHPDSGWDDYADGWDIVLPDGRVVRPNPDEKFTRTLWHPHVSEQPFTRSQSGVVIPESAEQVTIRAHDKRDGFGGKSMVFELRN